MAEAWKVALSEMRANVRAAGSDLKEAQSDLREAALNGGEALVYRAEEWMLGSSLVPTTPFLDPSHFEWTRVLEDGWRKMREELDQLLNFRDELPNFQDISRDVASISADDQWKTVFFMGYGYRSEANWKRCPETAALLEQIPGLTTAFFSILGPGKHLPLHRGPYRGVLRYHLGLRVPEPIESCGIEVGGETRHWENGKSLLFDDGYQHKAWNDSSEIRAVLFLDVVRPLSGLPGIANSALLKAIAYSPFLRDAKKRHEAWERRFENAIRQ